MKRFAGQKHNFEKFLKDGADQQDECWRKIPDLERQLQKLGTERFEEVKRRIEENDREEKRKVEYQQFLDVVSQHKKLLELTVYNCDLAIRAIGIIKELVAEGCSAIKALEERYVVLAPFNCVVLQVPDLLPALSRRASAALRVPCLQAVHRRRRFQ
jgi:hypothetical protein